MTNYPQPPEALVESCDWRRHDSLEVLSQTDIQTHMKMGANIFIKSLYKIYLIC